MNRDDVVTLLREASALDRWLAATDPESAQAMVDGWAYMLRDVELDAALRQLRVHYSEPDARTITPGDLLGVWRADRKREHQAAIDAANYAEAAVSIGDVELAPVFGSGAQYLADMMAAVERGEDPATVTRPAGVRVRTLSPEAEARERACRFPTICACTHLECRDGWLDEPGVRVNGQGRSYETAQPCPMCADGVLMAIETGLARKPRKGATR